MSLILGAAAIRLDPLRPAEFSVVSFTKASGPDAMRLISSTKAPPRDSANIIAMTLQRAVTENHHPRAHAAAQALSILLESPYLTLTRQGFEPSAAQSFEEFLRGSLRQ